MTLEELLRKCGDLGAPQQTGITVFVGKAKEPHNITQVKFVKGELVMLVEPV